MKRRIAFGLLLAVTLAPLAEVRAETPAEVPFKLVDNQIVVSAMLNGKGPYPVTIDTSSDLSTVDISAALKMGLTVNPAGEEVEGGETEEGTVYDTRFTSVELGQISTRDVDALAGGMVQKIARKTSLPIVGVLGNNFFSGRVLQIDYARHVLRFPADFPAAAAQPGRRAVLSFKDEDGLVIDDVGIQGEKMKAVIATGRSEAVSLTNAAAAKLGMAEPPPAPKPKAGRASAAPPREVSVRALSLGGISVESVSGVVLPPDREKRPWAAALGNGFLKEFLITIDFSALKVCIERP